MIQNDLDNECYLLTSSVPQFLRLAQDDFAELWKLHPEKFHKVRTPRGVLVPTPRWQQAYGKDYVYTGSKNNALPIETLTDPLPVLAELFDWCRREVDGRLNGVLLNWYDGSLGHYVGKHRDSRTGLLEGTPNVAISYGETRTFRMRPYPYRSGGEKRDFAVEDGSVVVLPWKTNLLWTHEITKSKRCTGRRVSITLRAFE
ncbi:MAG: alpha-ketoglutarate-dependent dioxygenase AlkB [Deltaproteobacteria bacterium]|nr:alpha-ketoglutarate-dependent dioxygenase AlkB [Deltaproteobacteria bacterium]